MNSLKVPRTSLLESVVAHKTKLRKNYDADLAKYEAACPKYIEAVLKALHKALDDAEQGKLPKRGYYSLEIPCSPAPQKPLMPKFDQLDRDIKLLQLSTEEFITVRSDSAWGAYL